MGNAELVALLREARDFMRQAAISRGPCPDCTECDRRDAIIANADAALAAHAAVPPSKEKVKWELTYDSQSYSARIPCGMHDWQLTAARLGDGRCVWYALAGYAKGYCDTLDEAKAAAVAAARGLR